ncbi:cytochrome c1 [Fodinicurvata sediminis]|uniref:cytochrome c1 n=1 Tax=Fodinicurvata sediminis TaxID=1121832 RepID=UPI0003B6F107|nr:cytochrome c1 [Fodinicurvata sediminis]
MKKLALSITAAIGLLFSASAASAAEGVAIPERDWSFQGFFGTYDRGALQRGFQVYEQVCSACHSLRFVAFRNLSDLGYNDAEIRAIAAEYSVEDGPDENGEMFMRDATASDKFPAPFANEEAARAANGGAYPPDLSLMAKARAAGPDYIYALLTGYTEAPEDVELMSGMYYNEYFPGHQIAMAPPLSNGIVEYADGTEATVSQMSADLSEFLMWAAEPKLEERKQMGVKVILFLLIFTGLVYAAKRKLWANLH